MLELEGRVEVREALGLLTIQAPLWGLGRRTGGWDEGMALIREFETEIHEGLWEQNGGGGSPKSTKK